VALAPNIYGAFVMSGAVEAIQSSFQRTNSQISAIRQVQAGIYKDKYGNQYSWAPSSSNPNPPSDWTYVGPASTQPVPAPKPQLKPYVPVLEPTPQVFPQTQPIIQPQSFQSGSYVSPQGQMFSIGQGSVPQGYTYAGPALQKIEAVPEQTISERTVERNGELFVERTYVPVQAAYNVIPEYSAIVQKVSEPKPFGEFEPRLNKAQLGVWSAQDKLVQVQSGPLMPLGENQFSQMRSEFAASAALAEKRQVFEAELNKRFPEGQGFGSRESALSKSFFIPPVEAVRFGVVSQEAPLPNPKALVLLQPQSWDVKGFVSPESQALVLKESKFSGSPDLLGDLYRPVGALVVSPLIGVTKPVWEPMGIGAQKMQEAIMGGTKMEVEGAVNLIGGTVQGLERFGAGTGQMFGTGVAEFVTGKKASQKVSNKVSSKFEAEFSGQQKGFSEFGEKSGEFVGSLAPTAAMIFTGPAAPFFVGINVAASRSQEELIGNVGTGVVFGVGTKVLGAGGSWLAPRLIKKSPVLGEALAEGGSFLFNYGVTAYAVGATAESVPAIYGAVQQGDYATSRLLGGQLASGVGGAFLGGYIGEKFVTKSLDVSKAIRNVLSGTTYIEPWELDPIAKWETAPRTEVISPEKPLRLKDQRAVSILEKTEFKGLAENTVLPTRTYVEKRSVEFLQQNPTVAQHGSRMVLSQLGEEFPTSKDFDFKVLTGTKNKSANLEAQLGMAKKWGEFVAEKGQSVKAEYNPLSGVAQSWVGGKNIAQFHALESVPTFRTKQGVTLETLGENLSWFWKNPTNLESEYIRGRGTAKDLPKLKLAVEKTTSLNVEDLFLQEHRGYHGGNIVPFIEGGTYKPTYRKPSTVDISAGLGGEPITYFAQNKSWMFFRDEGQILVERGTPVLEMKNLPKEFRLPAKSEKGRAMQAQKYAEFLKDYEGSLVPSAAVITGQTYTGLPTSTPEAEWFLYGNIKNVKKIGHSIDITKGRSERKVFDVYSRMPYWGSPEKLSMLSSIKKTFEPAKLKVSKEKAGVGGSLEALSFYERQGKSGLLAYKSYKPVGVVTSKYASMPQTSKTLKVSDYSVARPKEIPYASLVPRMATTGQAKYSVSSTYESVRPAKLVQSTYRVPKPKTETYPITETYRPNEPSKGTYPLPETYRSTQPSRNKYFEPIVRRPENFLIERTKYNPEKTYRSIEPTYRPIEPTRTEYPVDKIYRPTSTHYNNVPPYRPVSTHYNNVPPYRPVSTHYNGPPPYRPTYTAHYNGPPPPPPTRITRTSLDWKMVSRKVSGDKKFSLGYVPELKVRGKFKPLSKNALSFGKALNLGKKFAAGTSAATFRLRPAKGLIQGASEQATLGKNFYAKKGQSLTFIEKNQFRINTPGELEEITMKGWSAGKMKKGRKSWL